MSPNGSLYNSNFVIKWKAIMQIWWIFSQSGFGTIEQEEVCPKEKEKKNGA